MENNAIIYSTVLKTISIHTIVFKKCFKIAQEFEDKIKYQGEQTKEYWQSLAYNDFINLLSIEIKNLKDLQSSALQSIIFLIKETKLP